jgi:hypothetical protein
VENHGVWLFSERNVASSETFISKISTKYANHSDLDKTVQSLFAIWDRALHCIEAAIKSYFSYICDVQSPRIASKSGKEFLTSALRLLQLVVSYGSAYENLFDRGFKSCNLQPWISILPQLLSRLGHSDKIVRSLLTNLILRIGTNNPMAVIFPIVVGSRSEKVGPNQHLSDSYRQLLALMKQESLALEVARMISEFQRITLLWEERWFFKLGAVQNELRRRFARIRVEVKRLMGSSLEAEVKESQCRGIYSIIMSPVIEDLRKLEKETVGSNGATAHEIKFKDQYGSRICQALEALENDGNYGNVKQGWTLFEKVLLIVSVYIQLLMIDFEDIR